MAPHTRPSGIAAIIRAGLVLAALLLPIATTGQAAFAVPVTVSTVDSPIDDPEEASTAPIITSDVYGEGVPSGGIGVLGTFFFTPRQADVLNYAFVLTGPAPLSGSLVASGTGTASLPWTPVVSGDYALSVSSSNTVGASTVTTYQIVVAATVE